ncbi:hypothetical protein G1L02_12445 [Tenacibaculum finnmarkense]|uniref:hypothetical protein n=1 Tax=Tenacibaculum finnmarkense TaxID=2781243 RepID=UPI001EFB5628|nr:hypothetical protein [Tenacibaculum finnmarkense]MCG8883961.1 hypothetical protein [Tenacibaculum finnmarkense]
MSEFHCLDIEFPNVDFSRYFIKTKTEVKQIHHAHLYTRQDEIELRIFYEDSTYFGEKLSTWISSIDSKKFGSFIKIKLTENHTNERLQKIDLSEAKLSGLTNSSNYYKGKEKYIIVKIDTVKFYWNPNEENKNTAEFYLDDKGFRVVNPFYGIFGPKTFFKNDGKFEISRMKDSTKFYKLDKSSFRPEFNVYSKDNKKDRTATIIKEPKIQFKYQKEVTEKETIFYGNIVLMLASFYHHLKIDYTLRRIHLTESTITIKNIEEKNYFDTNGSLWGFEIYWDFNKFLKSSWQKETIKNFDLLSKAVTLFNQSHLVDNSSAFLIRYNIIEICDKQKQNKEKFTLTLSKRQRKEKQEEALAKLLETIKEDEHEVFKKRWRDIQALLQNKPMKNQLVSFLESQNLDPKTFPIGIRELNELRNNITHGSIDKVDLEQLRKANILLYRISGILILNLMGIKDWKLNTEIK